MVHVAAQEYIGAGFRAIELVGPAKGGKRPVSNSWQTQAQTDPNAWRPDANVGLVTGILSGFVVLDVDGPQGQASLDELEALHGPLPPGPRQVTGSGGSHILFRYTDSCALLTNRGGFREGLDFRTNGGQIVVAPSVHVSGQQYEWTYSPLEYELPDLPPWLHSVLSEHLPKPANGPDFREQMDFAEWLELQEGTVTGQAGGTAMMRIARVAVRKARVPDAATFADIVLASKWNRTRCIPPWTDRAEIEKRFTDAHGKWQADGLVWIPCNKQGQRYKTHMDLRKIVREDPQFAGRLRTNDLGQVMEYDGQRLTDARVLCIRTEICERYDYRDLDASRVLEVLTEECEANHYSPVVDYLDSVEWDGIPRLDYLAPAVLGCSSEVGAVMVRKWLIAAVARAYSPGCVAEDALILYSATQGIGKSSFFRIMGGPWFRDTPIDLANKDAFDQIGQAWIYEWSELESMFRASDIKAVKAFLSSREDSYRRAYGRLTEVRPRRVVFGGSANQRDLLNDRSGSRRFFVLECMGAVPHPDKPSMLVIDLASLVECRDQIWAEARVAYRSGEDWRLTGKWAQLQQEEAVQFQPDAPVYENAKSKAEAWPDAVITFSEACTRLNVSAESLTPVQCREIGQALSDAGYMKKRKLIDGKNKHVYVKANS